MSPDAFASLYRHYHHRVLVACRYYLRDRTEAEDLAQQVFICWWRTLTTTEVKHPEALLFGIVRQRARNWKRDRIRRCQLQDAYALALTWESDPREATAEADADLRERVEASLPHLTAPQQQVVRLSLDGVGSKEIGRRMHLRDKQMIGHRDRACVKLAALLAGPAKPIRGSPRQRAPILQHHASAVRHRHPEWTYAQVACEVVRATGYSPSRQTFAACGPSQNDPQGKTP
ncbi:MAG TPA: RNA polymerase sigma factor [Longimicrobium sp.]|jgi:RNA polymerase sigma-70 factor (ECF subfamily)